MGQGGRRNDHLQTASAELGHIGGGPLPPSASGGFDLFASLTAPFSPGRDIGFSSQDLPADGSAVTL
jgi:hypothetical protein